MVTIFVLVYFTATLKDNIEMNLAYFPTKEQCEEIRSHATSDKQNLHCIGIIQKDGEKPHEFSMKKWF